MPRTPDINRLYADRDLPGLLSALRFPRDPTIRMQAARSLGEIGSLRAVESLLRSHFQDPEITVRSAAHTALHQVLGTEAERAISAFVPPDEEWIDESLLMEAELEESEVDWNESDIQGLIAVVREDHDRQKRIKALQALSQIENTRAIDALASIATWSDESWLKHAARQALADVYGDDLDEILKSYRQSALDAALPEEEDEDDGEEDYEDEDEFEDDGVDEWDEEDADEEEDGDLADGEAEENSFSQSGSAADDRFEPSFPAPVRQTRPTHPVIQEEKPGLLAYILLGLLFVLIVAGLLYFLLR